MPRDKSGEQITWKEFFHRWGQGIRNITPYQQSKITYQNTYIMLFGIFMGVFFTLFRFKELWWLTIILIAAFVNTSIVQLGNYQKYQTLKRFETIIKEVKENE